MDILTLLILGGLMGLLGQGARAVIGLKGMADDAKALDLSPNDLFEAGRLLTSLIIGFLVGLAAALVYMLNGGAIPIDHASVAHTLLGFAASGYLGVDFLEGFISQYLPPGASGTALKKIAAKQATAAPKTPLNYAQAEQLVLQVFAERGQAGVTDKTKLADIGYSNSINIAKLYASVNQALIEKYGASYALPNTVTDKWSMVGDIVTSVQSA